jgi:adenylosuccinate lyase
VKVGAIVGGLVVFADQMLANLELTGGLIYSGTILLELCRKGILRETAYKWVQRNAMRVWDENADFRTLILNDPDIREHLSEAEVEACFNYREKLKYVDTVFERVFGRA